MSGQYYMGANPFEGSFAEESEIRETFGSVCFSDDTINAAGLTIISDGKKAVVDDSESSTGVVSSTGAGKTRRVLMEYTYSCIRKGEAIVCHDPKGEILRYMRTTLDQEGYKVLVLDYRDPMRGERYNPLEHAAKIYKSGNKARAMEMFSSFSSTIFERFRSEKDPYWHQTAQALNTGYLGLMAEEFKPEEITIDHVYDVHVQGDDKVGGTSYIKEYFDEKQDSIAYKLMKPAITAPNETRSSVYSVFSSGLTSFIQNESVIDMTTNSTFDVNDLLEKTALFIITRDEANVYDALISATIDQLFSLLVDIAEEKYNGRLPRRVEFIIDEFGALSPIPNINMKLTASRSRNIRWLLVYQSLEQLSLIYGEKIAPIIIGNCSNLVYMFSSDMGLLKMISERCGTTVDEYTNERRPLISVERLQHFDKDSGECLMLLNRMAPFVAHLPDISDYEQVEPVEALGVKRRERQEIAHLDFKALVEKERDKRYERKLELEHIEAMIKEMDEADRKDNLKCVPLHRKKIFDQIIRRNG